MLCRGPAAAGPWSNDFGVTAAIVPTARGEKGRDLSLRVDVEALALLSRNDLTIPDAANHDHDHRRRGPLSR